MPSEIELMIDLMTRTKQFDDFLEHVSEHVRQQRPLGVLPRMSQDEVRCRDCVELCDAVEAAALAQIERFYPATTQLAAEALAGGLHDNLRDFATNRVNQTLEQNAKST